MMGGILILLLVFIGGAGALLFSILAWRLKRDVFFYLGAAFTAILLIYMLFNIEYYWWSLQNAHLDFSALIMVGFIGLSVYFLISSKISGNQVPTEQDTTDAFLDEIINDDDDEIDYE